MRSIPSGRGRSLSTATSSPMSFQNAPTGNPSRRRRITFSLWGMSAMSWDSKRCATGTRYTSSRARTQSLAVTPERSIHASARGRPAQSRCNTPARLAACSPGSSIGTGDSRHSAANCLVWSEATPLRWWASPV